MSVVIKNIRKRFGHFTALDDVSIQVQEGEFMALLGPSGSGKTTLLRIIAGLEWPDEGEVFLQGVDVSGKPIRERRIGFVFQHFALFKHMTVFENIAFGLRLKRPRFSNKEIRERVEELLHLVHLGGIEKKVPSELSGGQRQRVALARVLAVEPRYMLLDEPFGALDAKVRKELRRWLKKLHDTTGLTTIFVTHDQEEAMEIADRIAVMDQGKLIQVGSPLELWEHPKNAFIFDFLGNYNTFIGYQTEKGELIVGEEAIRELKRSPDFSSMKSIQAFSRPHEVILEREPFDPALFLPGHILLMNQAGPTVKMELEGSGGTIYQVDMEKEHFHQLNPQMGETVWVKPVKYRSFDV